MDAYTKERADQREERILSHMALVRRIARAVAARVPRHVDSADLESAGTVGLIRAVDSWDPSRGVAFEAFAVRCIRGAVLDHLRAQDPLPYSTRAKIRRIEEMSNRLQKTLLRFPDEREIAQQLGMKESEVSALMAQAASAALFSPDELTALVADDPDNQEAEVVQRLEWQETVQLLSGVLKQLPDQERNVIVLYYYERLKMREIAAVLGVSESRISQVHGRAVTRLRAQMRQALEVVGESRE